MTLAQPQMVQALAVAWAVAAMLTMFALAEWRKAASLGARLMPRTTAWKSQSRGYSRLFRWARWPLHRAHHSPAAMRVRVIYRNNDLYYARMPGLWLSGILLFLSFGWVSAGFMSDTPSSSSASSWLRTRLRAGTRLCTASAGLRRWHGWSSDVISTPATHFAHHALVQDDGIRHYSGNYGNLCFVWDVLFGTVHFSRRYPSACGLTDDRTHGPEPWLAQLAFPLVRSNRADSVLGAGRHAPAP